MNDDCDSEVKRLRLKLDKLADYLELWDHGYRCEGLDFKPPGWDMTLQQAIRWLREDDSCPEAK